MKKTATLILTALLAVSMTAMLASCGGDGDTTTKASQNNVNTSAPKTTTAAANKTTSKKTETTTKPTTTDNGGGEEPEYDLGIGTVDEWNAFAENPKEYEKGLVQLTADIDFTGKEFKPLNDAVCIIDGAGHTLSGITVTVEDAKGGDNGNYGLIANKLSNNMFNAVLTNLTVKDSTLNVTVTEGTPNVGLIGKLDRANASNITLDNVTINVTGAANVGIIAGARDWATSDTDNANAGFEAVGAVSPAKDITVTKTTVNATESTVGVLYGSMGGDAKAEASNVNITAIIKASNEVTAETLVASVGEQASITTGEGVTVNLVESFS